jgi:sarcosine oxidase
VRGRVFVCRGCVELFQFKYLTANAVTESFDCIVLGVGGFGSGTLYHLARRGARVLGIEQFGVAHDRGSSHGQTRIIRKAYFEHPDYVPLLQRAYDLWRDLERSTSRTLLHQVGLFIAGRPDCESVSGTLLAARLHNLPVEQMSPAEAGRRFPGHRFADDFEIVFEPEAGYLEVENCVAAHIAAATRAQAQLRTDETVVHWESDGGRVLVKTDKATYSAASLVITAGPWAGQLLEQIGRGQPNSTASLGPAVDWRSLFRVVRKPVFWFAADATFDESSRNPTYFYETSAGQFYGFPRIDGRSIKVAEHTEGDPVADPLLVDRDQHPADLARLWDFLRDYLPTISPVPVGHSVCMYTRTPDCHFCIDRHPEWPNVVIGAGFSGHGFKFTTVLGEALADLALTGKTALPIEFLSTRRLLGGG